MARHPLNELLQDWADWCRRPEHHRASSMIARLMEQGAQFGYGPTGGPLLRAAIEDEIEAAVLALAAVDADAATALRIEYGAIFTGLAANASQVRKAEAAGVCLKTYKTRLQRGRAHVTQALKERRT